MKTPAYLQIPVLAAVALVAMADESVAQKRGEDTIPIPSLDALDSEAQRELASLIDLAEANAKRNENEKAIDFFQQAFELFPHPQLLYRMAVVQERAGKLAAAADNYETFSRSMPDAAEAPSARRKALELREELRQREQQDRVADTSLRILSNPPGAQVYFNGPTDRLMGSTPTVDLPVRPGKYTVIVKMEGYQTKEKRVEVKEGEHITERFALEVDPAMVKEDPRKDKAGSGIAPWVMLGVGAAGLGGGIVTGVLWSNSYQGEDRQSYTEEEWRTTRTYEGLTYGFGGLAILGVTGALILWLTAERGYTADLDAPTTTGVQAISPWMWRQGGGIHVEWRF